MATTIPLAQYLFTRLKQLNCHSIHGVPGDFLLRALDFLPASRVRWLGNANELCAGYAADGYARAAAVARLGRSSGHGDLRRPRVGAVFTTMGVGELSAINAVAGSYSEGIPLVNIVGHPSREQWRNGTRVHHTLGDGNMGIFAEMGKMITCAQAYGREADVEEAVAAYDAVLEECVKQSKPVYIGLPNDIVSSPVQSAPLSNPLNLEPDFNHPETQEQIISSILSRIQSAQRPLLIADGLSYPWDFADEVNELVRLTNIPAMCYSAGKGIIDETLPSWAGPLLGPTELSTSTDLALLFGPLLSDTNTAAWTAIPDVTVSISFGLDRVDIGGQVYNLRSKELLRELVKRLNRSSAGPRRITHQDKPLQDRQLPMGSSQITQDDFWPRMAGWLQPHDTVILANGTPLIGGRDMPLSAPTHVIASGIWCSIGQMLPAAQGVAAARQDLALPGRTILFEGDGSFQVTCQSLSDIIRYRLDVTIFMVNNSGYAYERWLNGMEAEYNDVPAWRYTSAPTFFGAPQDSEQYPVISKTVTTWNELEAVLADERIAGTRGLKFIDIAMGPDDVPTVARPGLIRAGEILKAS